ncbi:hypothetical protein EV182_006403, partial [Spiromyces aspiralis]
MLLVRRSLLLTLALMTVLGFALGRAGQDAERAHNLASGFIDARADSPKNGSFHKSGSELNDIAALGSVPRDTAKGSDIPTALHHQKALDFSDSPKRHKDLAFTQVGRSVPKIRLTSDQRCKINEFSDFIGTLLGNPSGSNRSNSSSSSFSYRVGQLLEHLEELGEMVHSFDVGLELSSDEGLVKTLLDMTDTSRWPHTVCLASARMLASMFQNNPPAQITAARLQAVPTLIARLDSTLDPRLLSSYIHIVGGLVRGNKACLDQFDSLDGLARVRDLLTSPGDSLNSRAALQRRLVA